MRKILSAILLLYLVSSSACLRTLTELKETLDPETYKVLEEASQFAKIYKIEPGDKVDKSELSLKDPRLAVAPLAIAYGAVLAASVLYKGICFLFGHSKTVTWTDIPMEKGFAKVNQQVMQYQLRDIWAGDECKNFETLIKVILTLTKIRNDPAHIKQIRHAFKMAKYVDARSSQKKDFFFNGKTPGTIDYLSLTIFKGEDEKYVPPAHYTGPDAPLCPKYDRYHLSLVWMTGTFKLNSNVRLVRTDERWGIFKSKLSEEIKELPRGLEPADIDSLFNFYNIITLKNMCDFFDIPYEWPPIKYLPRPRK